MAVFIGVDGIPSYIATTSEIRDDGTIDNVGFVGKLIYFTDNSSWGIVLDNGKIGTYVFGTGTTGTAPIFVSAEVGMVDASTLVLTLNQNIVSANVNTPNYKAGFSIQVNGVNNVITSATRQSNHAVIYFSLTTAVTHGQTVKIIYDESQGGIRSETGSVYMSSFNQTATNNT